MKGARLIEFDEQISDLERIVQDCWKTTPSERTGNPLYETPSVLVLYRKDHEWPLAPVIPQKGVPAPRIRPHSRCPTLQGEIDGEGQGQKRTCSLGALPGSRGLYGRHSVNRKGPGDGDNSGDLAQRGPLSHASPGASERTELAAKRQPSGTPVSELSRIPGHSSAMTCGCRPLNWKPTSAPRRCWQVGTPQPMSLR